MFNLFVTTLAVAIYSTVLTSPTYAELACPAQKRGNVCADDCKTLMVCTPSSTTPIISNKCSDLSSSSPYCVPGKTGCSETKDPDNTKCTSNFVCTNEGYFPDPRSCTQYYVCVGDEAHQYVCPSNNVYDALNSRCKVKRYSSDCVTINCAASKDKYVAHPKNKAYYAFCGGKPDASKDIMFRCDDTINYQFNSTSVSCEFSCSEEGTYPDITDSKNYYECYKSGGKWLSRVQTCPTSLIFDGTRKLCVKDESATAAQAPVEPEAKSRK